MNRNHMISILAITILVSLTLTGCSNSDSAVAPSAAVDTAPPAVPTGLVASAGRSAVKLTWLANNIDSDLQGYMVYRLAFGQAWPLTETPITNIGFIDRAPNSGESTYAVNSVDFAGNESAWATIRYNRTLATPDRIQ